MKKNTRKIIRAAFCLALALLTLFVFVSCHDDEKSKDAQDGTQEHLAEGTIAAVGGEMTWTLDVDGTLTISGTGEMPDYSYMNVPWFDFCPLVTKVVVEEGVTRIGAWTFHLCEEMTSISLPESLRSIGTFAIRDCTALTSITIPAGVTELGDYFIIGDASLEKIEVAYGNKYYKSINNCLIDSDGVIIAGCKNSVIPTEGVWKIGAYAFSNFWELKEITIPENITEIGRYAFGDTGLTGVTITDAVTVIAPYTFYKCTHMQSVSLPDTLVEIGEQAFSGNDSLLEITIPASVQKIGKRAFYGVKYLSDIYYEGTLADWAALNVDTDDWQVQTESTTIHCTDGDIYVKTYDDQNDADE